MAKEALDTDLLDRAIVLAVKSHAGTERRGKGFPSIVHPLEAMAIVATMTSDQEMLAAAVLHDTVEDTDVTLEEIRAEFGDRVATLVAYESEEKIDEMSAESSWHARKQATLDRLAAAPHDAKGSGVGRQALEYARHSPRLCRIGRRTVEPLPYQRPPRACVALSRSGGIAVRVA